VQTKADIFLVAGRGLTRPAHPSLCLMRLLHPNKLRI